LPVWSDSYAVSKHSALKGMTGVPLPRAKALLTLGPGNPSRN